MFSSQQAATITKVRKRLLGVAEVYRSSSWIRWCCLVGSALLVLSSPMNNYTMIKSLNELEVYWWENGLCATSTLQPFVLLPHLLFAASQKERSIQASNTKTRAPSTAENWHFTRSWWFSCFSGIPASSNSIFVDKKEILNVFSFLLWCWYDVSTYIYSHPDHDKRESFIKKEVEDDVPPSAWHFVPSSFVVKTTTTNKELVWLAR